MIKSGSLLWPVCVFRRSAWAWSAGCWWRSPSTPARSSCRWWSWGPQCWSSSSCRAETIIFISQIAHIRASNKPSRRGFAPETQFHVYLNWVKNACLALFLSSISVLNVKAVVAAFNQEKALVGAFSVIKNLRMELFEALDFTERLFIPSFI